jgi:hypothetical protein
MFATMNFVVVLDNFHGPTNQDLTDGTHDVDNKLAVMYLIHLKIVDSVADGNLVNTRLMVMPNMEDLHLFDSSDTFQSGDYNNTPC